MIIRCARNMEEYECRVFKKDCGCDIPLICIFSFVCFQEGVQTSNLTIGKRIDNLLFAAADMRQEYKHIFTHIAR